MASSSKSIPSESTPNDDTTPKTKRYPQPVTKHEDVVVNPTSFNQTLMTFLNAIGRNFQAPTIEDEELDLHLLYKEVTSRGGFREVMKDKRWKELSSAFNFRSAPTNLSTVLRRHYCIFLWDFEQVYFFGAQGPLIPRPPLRVRKSISNSTANPPWDIGKRKTSSPANSPLDKGKSKASTPTPAVNVESFLDNPVSGVITGKFEYGYLISVIVDSERVNGILYHI